MNHVIATVEKSLKNVTEYNMQNMYKWSKIPTYGDLMSLDAFVNMCETCCFFDYDGFGYYASASQNKMSDKMIIPSDVTGKFRVFNMKTGKYSRHRKRINIDRTFTDIVWFNR